jgi:hypothetical protein
VLLLRRGLLPARRLLDMDSELAFRLVFIDRSGWLMLLPADASVFFFLVVGLESTCSNISDQRTTRERREEEAEGRKRRRGKERTLGLAEACDQSRRRTSFGERKKLGRLGVVMDA